MTYQMQDSFIYQSNSKVISSSFSYNQSHGICLLYVTKNESEVPVDHCQCQWHGV